MAITPETRQSLEDYIKARRRMRVRNVRNVVHGGAAGMLGRTPRFLPDEESPFSETDRQAARAGVFKQAADNESKALEHSLNVYKEQLAYAAKELESQRKYAADMYSTSTGAARERAKLQAEALGDQIKQVHEKLSVVDGGSPQSEATAKGLAESAKTRARAYYEASLRDANIDGALESWAAKYKQMTIDEDNPRGREPTDMEISSKRKEIVSSIQDQATLAAAGDTYANLMRDAAEGNVDPVFAMAALRSASAQAGVSLEDGLARVLGRGSADALRKRVQQNADSEIKRLQLDLEGGQVTVTGADGYKDVLYNGRGLIDEQREAAGRTFGDSRLATAALNRTAADVAIPGLSGPLAGPGATGVAGVPGIGATPGMAAPAPAAPPVQGKPVSGMTTALQAELDRLDNLPTGPAVVRARQEAMSQPDFRRYKEETGLEGVGDDLAFKQMVRDYKKARRETLRKVNQDAAERRKYGHPEAFFNK